MSHFIKHTTVLALLAVLTFGSFIPSASAATPASQLGETLSALQSTLKHYLTLLTPEPQVAGVETIVVSNDQELLNAIKSVTGGETIQLKPGTYSKIYIQEIQYAKIFVGTFSGKRAGLLTSPVTITSADPKNRAVVESIETRTAPLWRFDSLSIRPNAKKVAVALGGDRNVITNSDISFGDSTSWTKDDWNLKTGNGVNVRGAKDVEVSFNHIRNVNFGINILHKTPGAVVRGNVIEYFNGDGMRGLGDNALFEHNLITNPLQTNANHSDGFQSWVDYADNNRPVENVTLQNNTFLYQTESHPFRAHMQGVGMFDGPFKGWKIENNLLVINHWHGITVAGGIDSAIRNNVVIDPNSVTPGPAGTRFGNTKTGATPQNSVSENNIGNNTLKPVVGVTIKNNKDITLADYDTYFVDYRKENWNLKSGVLPYSVGAKEYRMYFKPGQTLEVGTGSVPSPVTSNTPAPAPGTLLSPIASNNPTPVSPLPEPIVSNNPTPVSPLEPIASNNPTPVSPLPEPIVSNNPTPVPSREEVAAPRQGQYIQLNRRSRVMNDTLSRGIGFQDSGARGVIDSAAPEIRGMVKVNFERGVDGYMPRTLLTFSATAFEPATVWSSAKPFTLMKRMRVMDETLAINLGFQAEGARGTIDETIEPIIINGALFEKADFESGVDGYMPRSVLNFTITRLVPESASLLSAQMTSAQADSLLQQLNTLEIQLKAMMKQLK